MGKTDVEVSVLGFGAMRLPMVGAKSKMDSFDPNIPIDEIEATKMVEYALEKGINYFDTAYGYHGGKSETFMGKVLKPYRSKVAIATKLPPWQVQKPEDFEKIFNEQLSKLETNYIDFYLIHGLGSVTWPKMKEMGVLHFLDKLKSSGRIRFAGFSFHDEIKVFKEIVDSYDWNTCLVQYNFYDQIYQAGVDGISYAASKGIGVAVMEPLRGGQLVSKIPSEIQALWDSAKIKRSPVEWAFRWVWNQENISTAVSGVSSLEQIVENTQYANDGSPNSLSNDELVLIDRVRTAYRKMLHVDCTGCGYCMPCPNGVNIPQNFAMYNDSFMFRDSKEINAFFYNQMLTPDQRASGCFSCYICEDLCPQKIKISQVLQDVHKTFAGS
jgi:predicted aldo/keto reductase-like oxidoreductase